MNSGRKAGTFYREGTFAGRASMLIELTSATTADSTWNNDPIRKLTQQVNSALLMFMSFISRSEIHYPDAQVTGA